MKIKLPVIEFASVFHVGTLNPSDKGIQFASSLEGKCLSVSHCPASWQKIARLGGNPWWELSADEILVLDALKLKRAEKDQIALVGINSGLLKKQEVFCVPVTDEEGEVCGYTSHLTLDAALSELGDDSPETIKSIKKKEILLATETLAKWSGWTHCADAFDIYLPYFVEKHAPSLLGVWWTEAWEPSKLSAPRGALIPSKIKLLRRKQIPDDQQWGWQTEKPAIPSSARKVIEVVIPSDREFGG